jgi:hypothetical protein
MLAAKKEGLGGMLTGTSQPPERPAAIIEPKKEDFIKKRIPIEGDVENSPVRMEGEKVPIDESPIAYEMALEDYKKKKRQYMDDLNQYYNELEKWELKDAKVQYLIAINISKEQNLHTWHYLGYYY